MPLEKYQLLQWRTIHAPSATNMCFLARHPVCQAWLCLHAGQREEDCFLYFTAWLLSFVFQQEKVEVLGDNPFTVADEGTDNPAFSHIEMDVASDKDKVNGLHIWHGASSAHEDNFVHLKHCWHSCAGSVTSPAQVMGRGLLSFVALSPLHDLDISQERNRIFLALPHSLSLWVLVTGLKAMFLCEIFA